MGILWVVIIVSLTGAPFGRSLPLKSTPEAYPHDSNSESLLEAWRSGSGLYAAVPALALVLTAVGLLFGCTWCYRHKDCKPNEGAENQLFTASATHLHDGRRSQPPDSGFSEPANNNISEDNNNGPISLREMQNIANNNATAYITSENEERNRASRESVVEFEPLPAGIRVADPLERCADWFAGDDFPRNQLQYLREIGRGWFGRVVEGEIEDEGSTAVAVKILNQNASLEDKARFLDEAKLYRDVTHENILAFIAKSLQEDPWILLFELCSMDLQQYLIHNRPKMAILNEGGAPLQLMCDVASALAYLHSRGYLYGNLSSSNVLVRSPAGAGAGGGRVRAVLGSYAHTHHAHEYCAPETRAHPPTYITSSEVWSLGTLIWEVCTWASPVPPHQPPPPELPCPYRNHLYQVMQLCWEPLAEARPSAAQVHALLEHLHSTHAGAHSPPDADFEARWQTLKPNTIPKLDEHVALVHVPSTSQGPPRAEPPTSRSSSVVSERDPPARARSESLNNLHGSLDDVRNIYLTHDEAAALDCHQGNVHFDRDPDPDPDRSDGSVDPWVKDLIAGGRDDVGYYRDVSDVIKNLDDILNSEKTSSSESSHQASPSRDNLSLDCKRECPIPSSMVKSPGITDFKNILEMSLDAGRDEPCDDDEIDRDTIGTLSHSFERHGDTTSQQTLENLTPDTPIKDLDIVSEINCDVGADEGVAECEVWEPTPPRQNTELPKENIDSSDSEIPQKDLNVVSLSSVSENEQVNVKDCVTSCDNLGEIVRTQVETKSIDNTVNERNNIDEECTSEEAIVRSNEDKENQVNVEDTILPDLINKIATQVIDTEVIHPAIEIVSRIKEKEELKFQEDNQMVKLPPTLHIRQGNNVNLINELPNDSIKEVTNTLLEEERKVCIVPYVKFAEILIEAESKVEKHLNDSQKSADQVEESFTATLNKVNAILPVTTSEAVQTKNADLPMFDKLTEEEQLAFSSNFTELNFEISNDMPSTLPPQLVQNNVTEKAEQSPTSSPLRHIQSPNEISSFNQIEDTNQVIDENNKFIDKSQILPTESFTENFNNEDITRDKNIEDSNDHPVIREIISQESHIPIAVEANSQTVTEESLQRAVKGVDKSLPLVNKFSETEPTSQIVEDNGTGQEETVKDFTHSGDEVKSRSERVTTEPSNDSTAYMDLINYNSEVNNSEIPQENVKECILSCLNKSFVEDSCTINKNDSTLYLDLPSVLKCTSDFLNSEQIASQEDNICASTPRGSECSADNTLEAPVKNDNSTLSQTKIAEETAIAKSEQKLIADLLSPFDSPTKSHPTDTFDENSSVVLGPFESYATDCKSLKAEIELPKEELLAFSSNFSEINLETPSPLRDGNFLNEVPDVAAEDLQFDYITISESKNDVSDNTDETDQSATTKRISPSTPPNSPGIYLASMSQLKYAVDIDLDPPETQPCPPVETDSGLSSLQKEIDLNQIELQMTTKLAMAENENNFNIEYSGPLTVEGLVCGEEAVSTDAMPEAFLAGNGAVEERSEGLSLDEECVQALRNELELKLPLAQVAGIEPACEASGSGDAWGELPPPPELIVHYGAGALSPIAEETRHQLTQYENDAWNPNTRTESSESYPEPCNDSTAEVTDLPTGAVGSNEHTYTINSDSRHHTYTVQKDIPTSREQTMSADSLNGSPYKKPTVAQSPVDDRTYNKNEDEKISNCERISQVSPFLMSPTTDTSVPDSVDNATGVSTLSKTTIPTDAKHSRPSECISKATSIDSWCSNDTLYNVEENFDDLGVEGEIPELESEKLELAKSASTDTLTHYDDEKETSHCSTYIVHDSKSEAGETFSPDSISGNDNYTYTKVKTEATGISPSTGTKSDVNESTKSQTKDLAYGTLPSHSNCTTELMSSIEDPWKFAEPEQIRKSPITDEVTFTPPRVVEYNDSSVCDGPQLTATAVKTDNVENSDSQILVNIYSPESYKNEMAPSITSTPITDLFLDDDDDNVEPIPIKLPIESEKSDRQDSLTDSLPNFQTFVQSAEIRPQDTTCNQDTALLLEGDSKTISTNSNKDSLAIIDRTPNYSDFEHSAVYKPQETPPIEKSSQNIESGMNSGDFRQFENSVKGCPQDLSSLIDANSLFLTSERQSSELAANSIIKKSNDQASPSMQEPNQNIVSPPSIASLVESQHVIPTIEFSMYVTDLDEEETDQPHSIIFTEATQIPKKVDTKFKTVKSEDNIKQTKIEEKQSPNGTYDTFDSHTETKALIDQSSTNCTFNSHTGEFSDAMKENRNVEPTVNGVEKVEHTIDITEQQINESPKTTSDEVGVVQEVSNRSLKECEPEEVICNGNSQNFATVNFINESFEELENVKDCKVTKELTTPTQKSNEFAIEIETPQTKNDEDSPKTGRINKEDTMNGHDNKAAAVTADFLLNEKIFCTTDNYVPLLGDIRFTGPASEIMSTSFTQDSPTEPESPECEQNCKSNVVSDIVKDWDSDTESHSSNSSSGEFIWKDGGGHETSVVPTTHFDHQQDGGVGRAQGSGAAEGAGSEASGDSGSGSEGDEVEFVPSSWDCRAAPSKSSLRSLDNQPPTDKKRVVFKRQKYHCVYEYPRELAEVDSHSPAYLPDLSTYCEWDPTSAEEAELGYGQLYGTPMDMYQLRSGIAFGSDYDDDFFISSSARPFESLGIMSTSSQFFPGMHLKPALVDRDDDVTDLPPPPASPLVTPLTQTRAPSLDFTTTTPDSGVEDITPGSTSTDEDFKTKTEEATQWKPMDSGSSSESVSPSSPGVGGELGGLRHTRDKLKLDLPPSPCVPASPRHGSRFSFVLDKPKRPRAEPPTPTPLVMTDDTPLAPAPLPLPLPLPADDPPAPEPTFSTFGKCKANPKEDDTEQKMILTDETDESSASPTTESKEETPSAKDEGVKGEGTVLDSGDEDSGIESSSKATLERKTDVS